MNHLAGLLDVRLTSLSNGQTITYNSTTKKWENGSGGGGGTPAGSDTWIQFNNAGAFGASADLTYDTGSTMLSVGASSGASMDLWGGRFSIRQGGDIKLYNGAESFSGVLNLDTLSADRTWSLPDITGVLAVVTQIKSSSGSSGALQAADGSGGFSDGIATTHAEDLTITDSSKGLVLTSPDSSTGRITIDNSDVLQGVTAKVVSGIIRAHSAYPVTAGNVFPNYHVGAGSNSKQDEGLGVAASIAADSTWRLRFWCPPVLPTGTCKLKLWALANATTGNAKVNAKWASVNAEEDPSSATLNAEGTSTLSWGAGDNDQYKELKITLDADTPVAGEMIVMDLVFETSSWTLAQVSTWIAAVVWE